MTTADIRLEANELGRLIESVFKPGPGDVRLAILVDLPDARTPDHDLWRARREMVVEWLDALDSLGDTVGWTPSLYFYPNVHANNADLPDQAWEYRRGEAVPSASSALDASSGIPMEQVLREHSIIIAPTEFSTTAPLKLMSKQLGFRAATMPGFNAKMIPALRLDYREIDRRVRALKEMLDKAEGCEVELRVREKAESHLLSLDLRFRIAHASGGLVQEPGTAGNLPSGETYIVPYEGENEPSRSRGTLPVELDGEVVLYEIEGNKAIRVLSQGVVSEREAALIRDEPAYANIAELGLGVLADFGIAPIGEILLDEKLGLHIAFGRSDHFGGQVGAKDFSRPDAVVHIDRVYVPEMQPSIEVVRVDLAMDDGSKVRLMQGGRWVIRL